MLADTTDVIAKLALAVHHPRNVFPKIDGYAGLSPGTTVGGMEPYRS
jgi:hypothetical protein